MMGMHAPKKELFSYRVDLDRRVRADHPLRRVRAMVDFTFARELVQHTYGHNGNESVGPRGLAQADVRALSRERAQRTRAAEVQKRVQRVRLITLFLAAAAELGLCPKFAQRISAPLVTLQCFGLAIGRAIQTGMMVREIASDVENSVTNK
jgi:transposase